MDAKKDILFIMNDLHSGGAQKALVSLLQLMDYSRFNVDLLLFKKEGIFLDQVPPQVQLLHSPDGYAYFDGPIVSAVLKSIGNRKFSTFIGRLLSAWVLKTEKRPAIREQKMWQFLSPSLGKLAKKYDAAIGFLEKTPNYYCIDKTTAGKKILWIHTNYSNMGMVPKYDDRFFDKASSIVTVSAECTLDLQKHFPRFLPKITTIHNIVSPRVICKMADKPQHINPNSIVTVGRMSPEKGIDLALEACKILREKGIGFTWYFIGDGTQRKELEATIAQYQLEQQVVFLGEKANPYPYVKAATVYAQTSRFEGKSIAIDEAKILAKPILTTNFSTAVTQLTHLENGYIAAMNPQAIAEGIITLLTDTGLRNQFIARLGEEQLGTENEMERFYQLIQ